MSKILGNKEADVAAKDVAHKGSREKSHSSSPTYIKSKLQKVRVVELVKWHQSESQERDATSPGCYVPQERDINPTLGRALKKYAMRYYQLKVGYEATGAFLA